MPCTFPEASRPHSLLKLRVQVGPSEPGSKASIDIRLPCGVNICMIDAQCESMLCEGDVVRFNDRNGYRCAILLLNWMFLFGFPPSNASMETFLLCLFSVPTLEDALVRVLTLGGGVGCITLGSSVCASSDVLRLLVCCGVNEVTRPSWSDSCVSALRMGSPALREVYTVDGGCWSRWTISPAACLRKSLSEPKPRPWRSLTAFDCLFWVPQLAMYPFLLLLAKLILVNQL